MVIPLDAAPGTSVPKRNSAKGASTGGATTLLVEDDPTLAAMLRERLGAPGVVAIGVVATPAVAPAVATWAAAPPATP
jgi:hypothetical protein